MFVAFSKTSDLAHYKTFNILYGFFDQAKDPFIVDVELFLELLTKQSLQFFLTGHSETIEVSVPTWSSVLTGCSFVEAVPKTSRPCLRAITCPPTRSGC